jgi:hypothetical protein
MGVGDKIKEGLADLGKRMIGRGAEVRYKNKIKENMDSTGATQQQAEVDVFSDYTFEVNKAVIQEGTVSMESQQWEDFTGAMDHIFEAKDIKQFREDASNPSVYRRVPIPPTMRPRDIKKITDYYQAKYEGDAPDSTMIEDLAKKEYELRRVLNRLDGNALRATDLRTMTPRETADIGRVYELVQMINKHEKEFHKRREFDKAFEQMKISGKEALAGILFKGPAQTVKNLGSYIKNIVSIAGSGTDLGGIISQGFRHTGTLFKDIGKTFWEHGLKKSGKFLGDAFKALRKKIF